MGLCDGKWDTDDAMRAFMADWLYDELHRDKRKSGGFGDYEDSRENDDFKKGGGFGGDGDFGDDGF